MNYGVAAPKDAYTERFLAGACSIVGSYGARDRANRGTAQNSAGPWMLRAWITTSRSNQTPATASPDHESAGDPSPLTSSW